MPISWRLTSRASRFCLKNRGGLANNEPGNDRDGERLREEALQAASPRYDEAIARTEFLNAKKGDDVLQFLIMRDCFADLFSNKVMLVTDNCWIEQN